MPARKRKGYGFCKQNFISLHIKDNGINTKATIIPIAIRGAFDILSPRSFQFNLNQTAEVHIGEPINAADFSLENKEELLRLVQNKIKVLAGED